MKLTLAERKAEALEKLMAIDGARRGQLSEQYYFRKAVDGKIIKQGPYYVWQRYIKGKKHSVRISAKQLEQVRAELARGCEVQEIINELWDIFEQKAEQQEENVKKKVVAVKAACFRETEAALELIRHKVQEGNLNTAWIERTLRDASLRDMAKLLEGFLNHELPSLMNKPQLKPQEQFHSYQTRKVTTVFGTVSLRRAYYRGPRSGRYPMDEALELHDQYTPTVIQLICWAGSMESSFELASETLQRFAGLTIPGRQVQRVINAFGKQAASWMHNRTSQAPSAPIDVLNIQTDMTGIPIRPEELQNVKGKQPDGSAKTRQIKLGCVFTQSCDAKGQPLRNPLSSTYLSAFCDRSDFGALLQAEALKRGYAKARKTVFIGDGAEWIWNLANERFKNAVQIVDFYHACEHLHALCLQLEPNELRAKTLFKSWRKRLKNNGLPRIIHEASSRLLSLNDDLRKAVEDEIRYFRNNASRMQYRTYRTQGFFIGSGAVEGACRHIVAQRTKLSGMRWLCAGAESVLAFRCIIKSNFFDDFCSQQKKAG